MTVKNRLPLSICKIMSTFLLLTVGVLIFLFLQPVTAQAASESDLSFYLNHDGQSYKVGHCEKTATGDLVIPATYNGLPVTEISPSAFYECAGLTGITIPEGITVIHPNTFYGCTGLKSITLPDSVEIIYQSAFSHCTALQSITLSKNLIFIDEWAFGGCSNLESITIPEGVTEIGWRVFEGCTKLTHISIPSSLVSFSENPFTDSPNLMYNIYDNGKYLGNADNPYLVLMESTAKDITQCQIHKDTKLIHYGAFADCTRLTRITVPDSVTAIGYYAFSNCTSLTDVTLGKSVRDINSFVFSGCDNLNGIWVAEENPNFSSNDLGILFNKSKKVLIKAPSTLKGEYTVPETVRSIGNSAFFDCHSLTGITFGKNVIYIDYYAFGNCSRLAYIQVAEDNPNYKTDSTGVLYNKEGTMLIQVPGGISGTYTVPEGVTSLFFASFSGCTSLQSIIIPSTVTSLGEYAFKGCTALQSITIPPSVTNLGTSVFEGCTALQSITIPTGVTVLAPSVFEGCTALQSVTIPSGLTYLGPAAFRGCTALQSIIIPSRVAYLGPDAFEGCTNLKTIYFTGGQSAWKKLLQEDFNEPPEKTEIVFGLPSETKPSTPPTTEPTTEPSADPTVPADNRQNDGFPTGVIFAVIAAVAIAAVVLVVTKKKKS